MLYYHTGFSNFIFSNITGVNLKRSKGYMVTITVFFNRVM